MPSRRRARHSKRAGARERRRVAAVQQAVVAGLDELGEAAADQRAVAVAQPALDRRRLEHDLPVAPQHEDHVQRALDERAEALLAAPALELEDELALARLPAVVAPARRAQHEERAGDAADRPREQQDRGAGDGRRHEAGMAGREQRGEEAGRRQHGERDGGEPAAARRRRRRPAAREQDGERARRGVHGLRPLIGRPGRFSSGRRDRPRGRGGGYPPSPWTSAPWPSG